MLLFALEPCSDLCKHVAGMTLHWLQAAVACALLAAAAAQPSVLAPLNLSLRAAEPRSAQPAPAQRRPAGSMSQPMAPAQHVRGFVPFVCRPPHYITMSDSPCQACTMTTHV